MVATEGEQQGDTISKRFVCNIWKKRNERPNDAGVSTRSRNGASTRKRCVVNGQMTTASNKGVRPPPVLRLERDARSMVK